MAQYFILYNRLGRLQTVSITNDKKMAYYIAESLGTLTVDSFVVTKSYLLRKCGRSSYRKAIEDYEKNRNNLELQGLIQCFIEEYKDRYVKAIGKNIRLDITLDEYEDLRSIAKRIDPQMSVTAYIKSIIREKIKEFI